MAVFSVAASVLVIEFVFLVKDIHLTTLLLFLIHSLPFSSIYSLLSLVFHPSSSLPFSRPTFSLPPFSLPPFSLPPSLSLSSSPLTLFVTLRTYTKEDEEDMVEQDVSNLWLHESRYRLPIQQATAGSWVLIEGVDSSIMKTATITHDDNEDAYVSPFHSSFFLFYFLYYVDLFDIR
jgi:hypothetical protein